LAQVAIFVHPGRKEAARLAEAATRWLAERGHEAHVYPGAPTDAPARLGPEVDLAVSLGGDGTMLCTVDRADGLPVLGVNVGRLGYLTEVDAGELMPALERFLSRDYQVEERMTLEVLVDRSGSGGPPVDPHAARVALNEAVVEKTLSGHTVRIALAIAGRPFITYAADGLLVSTPTGSTAYNLSARGPVASPSLEALLVTPVSPHMLFDRALVLEPSEWLRLQVLEPRPAALAVDGVQAGTLEPGDAVICRAGRQPARLVTFGRRDFHAILKAKFGLTDR
jgi:NAD+ kinase